MAVQDGTILVSKTSGESWLIEQGKRVALSSVTTLLAVGMDYDDIKAKKKVVDDQAINDVPVQTSFTPAFAGVKQVDSGNAFLGAGHYMHTWGSIDSSNGTVAMNTRTWTITMFGGYHGGVHLILSNAAGGPTWASQEHRYGVDGTWMGTSDRTQAWWENAGPANVQNAARVDVFHSWDPDSFNVILQKWIQAGQQIGQLVATASGVAKVFTALF